MFLSIVIPAFNEEKRLPKTLKKVRDYLNRQNITRQGGGGQAYEVIVVNDGSTDNTPGVLSGLIRDWPEFRLIDNRKNCGKGAVVKQGMLAAKGEWRLFMDADGSTDISELPKLWQFKNQKLKIKNQNEKFEIIIGSRYLEADSIKIKQPVLRRIISRLGNILVRILLGIKAADTQCGFKLFSKEAAEDIFPLQTIERWGFDMEILAIAIKKGYRIKEVPVDWYDAGGSQVKKSATWKTLKELWKIKRNLMRGNY